MRRQEQARHAFVATASHELRTPLASLDGMLELLEDDLDPQRLDIDDARERTSRAREQSRRLSSLASDLLDLSRLDAEVELRAEPVELGEVCRAVAAEFERRASERDVQVEMHPALDACWAQRRPGRDRADREDPARQRDAGWRRSGRACACGQPSRSRAQVIVSDSGPGVSEDERELIFERFQRGSAAGGRTASASGLAIGRELAARMGGSLELLEDRAGANETGARFALRLPACPLVEDDRAP